MQESAYGRRSVGRVQVRHRLEGRRTLSWLRGWSTSSLIAFANARRLSTSCSLFSRICLQARRTVGSASRWLSLLCIANGEGREQESQLGGPGAEMQIRHGTNPRASVPESSARVLWVRRDSWSALCDEKEMD